MNDHIMMEAANRIAVERREQSDRVRKEKATLVSDAGLPFTDDKFTQMEVARMKQEVLLREKYKKAIEGDRRARRIDPAKFSERMERLQQLESSLARKQQFLQSQFLNGTLPALAFTRQIQPDHEFRSRAYRYGR